jgi:hypothetical protein
VARDKKGERVFFGVTVYVVDSTEKGLLPVVPFDTRSVIILKIDTGSVEIDTTGRSVISPFIFAVEWVLSNGILFL